MPTTSYQLNHVTYLVALKGTLQLSASCIGSSPYLRLAIQPRPFSPTPPVFKRTMQWNKSGRLMNALVLIVASVSLDDVCVGAFLKVCWRGQTGALV